MAQATQIGTPEEDFWQITEDNGSVYTVPGNVARDTHPDAFPQAPEMGTSYADAMQGAPSAPVPPSWEQQAPEPDPELAPVQEAAWMQEQPPEEEMFFSPEQAGYGQPPEEEMEFTEEQAGYGPPQMAPGMSQGSSMSYSGPVGGYVEGESPGLANFDPQRAEYQRGMELREQGVEAQRQATGVHNEAQAKNTEEMAALRVETIRKQQEMHDFSRQRVEAKEAELTQARQAITRMDMNKVWKDTDASAKFAGVMAAGIAGWLNPTGKNSVIEQMSDLMDKSAREQAANIATEKYQLEGQERELGRFEEREGEEEALYLAHRVLLADNLQDQIKLEASKFSSAIMLGKLDVMLGAAKEEGAKAMQAWGQQEWQNANGVFQKDEDRKNARAMQQASFRHSRRMAQAKASARQEQKADLPLGTALFELPDGSTVYTKGGPLGIKIKPEVADRLRKQASSATLMTKYGRNMQVLLEEYSRPERLMPKGRTKGMIKQDIANLGLAMRPILGANFTEMERKEELKRWGDPNSWIQNPETGKALVKRAVDNIVEDLSSNQALYGMEVASDRGDGTFSMRKAEKGENLLGLGSLDMGSPAEIGLESSIGDVRAMKRDWMEATGAAEKQAKATQLMIKVERLITVSDAYDLDSRENKAMFRAIEEELSEIPANLENSIGRKGQVSPIVPYGMSPVDAFRSAVKYNTEVGMKKAKKEADLKEFNKKSTEITRTGRQ